MHQCLQETVIYKSLKILKQQAIMCQPSIMYFMPCAQMWCHEHGKVNKQKMLNVSWHLYCARNTCQKAVQSVYQFSTYWQATGAATHTCFHITCLKIPSVLWPTNFGKIQCPTEKKTAHHVQLPHSCQLHLRLRLPDENTLQMTATSLQPSLNHRFTNVLGKSFLIKTSSWRPCFTVRL